MKKFLVIGPNSFISKSINSDSEIIIDKISIRDRKNIENINFSQYESIINCAIHPNYINNEYDPEFDFDYQLASRVVKTNCHYVMISSRKVYGENSLLCSLKEISPKKPIDNYGKNKLLTEWFIRENFEENQKSFTIVRCSNVFGFEYGRKSFLGFCMNQLKDKGHISFDISSNVIRDFIPVNYLGQILKLIMEKKPRGIFNLSSNYGLQIGKIPQYLIEGYGSGYFTSNQEIIKDQFILDCSELEKQLKIQMSQFDYKNIINKIGEDLCKI